MSSLRCVLGNNHLWHPVSKATVSLLGNQTVRWRKPRWVPVAPSKKFKIPERTITPPEEQRELKRLRDNYNSQYRAVRRHLMQENIRTADNSELAMQQVAQEEEEHQRLMEYNRQENQRVAALREERVQKEYEANLALMEARKVRQAQRAAKAEEEALQIVNATQELVRSFIKREDLEKAIEEAMANPVDYNYAIDQDGYIFRGRNTRPEDVDEKDREKLASTVLI